MPIIRVQGLGKRYRIGRHQTYQTLRESIVNTATAPVRFAHSLLHRSGARQASANEDHIWAIRDVDFDVMPGEVMGIVGRNGAGKSTLLKLLSRITEPTTGRIELYGRVGSLLEVGTGFHPELTGRENIYLSGAILGMRAAEITRKFDEIVAFAEVEKFIDTPVKHFSSGMYVRLAFAVAAHLDPEILMVDEVLAVGDAAFQKKCLGRMGDVAREGRTVLFVSHNMAAVQSLCNSCLLLGGGRLEAKGKTDDIVVHYMASQLKADAGSRSLVDHPGRRNGSIPMMKSVELCSDGAGSLAVLQMGQPLSIRVKFAAPRPLRPILGVSLRTADGTPLFHVSNRFTLAGHFGELMQEGELTCHFDSLPLMPGTYPISIYFGEFADQTRDLDVVLDAISVEIIAADVLESGGRLPHASYGPVFWNARWTFGGESGIDTVAKKRAKTA